MGEEYFATLMKASCTQPCQCSNSQPKIPPSVHHTAYSKQSLSFSDGFKRLNSLPYRKHTTDLANGNFSRKPCAYTVDRLAPHTKMNLIKPLLCHLSQNQVFKDHTKGNLKKNIDSV